MDSQALRFLVDACLTLANPPHPTRGDLKEFAARCNLSSFACRPSDGLDERVAHVHLMDSLIGSALTSEPGESRMA